MYFIRGNEFKESVTSERSVKSVFETFLDRIFGKKKIELFISYSMQDSSRLKIPEIAKELTNQFQDGLYCVVHYWEGWGGYPDGNIIDFMDENIANSDIFIQVCTEASMKSRNCKKERDMAFFQNKQVIPLYEQYTCIPRIFQPYKGIDILNKPVDVIVNELFNQIMLIT